MVASVMILDWSVVPEEDMMFRQGAE